MIRNYLGHPLGLVLRGVAALLFGVATLLWPDVTLWVLVLMWGAFALVDGTIALVTAISDRYLAHRGWVAFWGVTGIVTGVVTFLWPSITAMALLVLIAVWALLGGVTMIAMAISGRKQIKGAWLVALGGVLNVALGVVLLANPVSGALAITWAIGWYACLYGTLSFGLAWYVHKQAKEADRREQLGSSPQQHAMN